MKFPKQVLKELLYGELPEEVGLTVVRDQLYDSSIWSLHYEFIFRTKQDKYYRTYYSKGATESQDESPFEYDEDMIECEEVKPVEKMIIDYVKI